MMEFGWSALGSIFSQAGLRKNTEEDKWEFTSAPNSPPPPPPVASKASLPAVGTDAPSAKLLPEPDDEKNSSQKKKKSRGRKKRGMSGDLSAVDKGKSDAHISWGHVDEILFERSIGFDSIPTKGEYPLGLGSFVEICTSSVDELFSRRQYLEILAANQAEADAIMSAQSLSKKKKPAAKKSNQRKDSYDHNADHAHHGTNTTPESMTSDELKQLMDAQVVAEADRIRKLSDLALHHNNAAHHDHQLTPTVLDEINHEILSIRNSREHIGCSCKPFKVDKMNVNQLKAKLHMYESQLPPSAGPIDKMKKADLMSHVKEFVKDCKQCSDNNCECVRLEIPCAFFACDCMKGSALDCYNAFGKDSFDMDRIDEVRKKVLIDWKVREAAENTTATEEAKPTVAPAAAAVRTSSRRKQSE
eukprot:gene4202-2995_t